MYHKMNTIRRYFIGIFNSIMNYDVRDSLERVGSSRTIIRASMGGFVEMVKK